MSNYAQDVQPPRLKHIVICTLTIVLIALTFQVFYVFNYIDRGMEIYDLGNETTKLASTLFFDKMTAIAQLSIALIGGAWALITFADVRLRPEGTESIICFALANLAFVSSLVIYALSYDFLVTRIFHHGTFDIDAPFVRGISLSQQFFFLMGCISLLVSIWMGRRQK